jgi:ACS family hexuronate transporter-like MFS transporter
MRPTQSLRWIAVTVFTFSSVLNYLDRSILATMVDIWRSKPEFPFNYSDYGTILAVFGLTYAIAAPFMGLFIDRVGLNRGISVSVLLWSLVSMGHGFVHSFRDLLFARAALGVVEASGISAAGKVGGMYLLPKERAVGAAMSQLGLSVGAGMAPAFTVYFAYHHNWRWAFFAAGILGLLWIPLWLGTSKAVPPVDNPGEVKAAAVAGMLKDPRLWGMAIANALSMTFYTLWTNWVPTYLVKMHHLTPKEASRYSWVVPFCGYFGAFLGGWISWQLISRKGFAPVDARKRVCFFAAIALLFSAFIPLAPTPLLATVGMSLSFFLISAWSTNLYTIPVDIYGAQRAAFGVSSLVFAYGVMQAIVSRPLGRVIEEHGFQPVLLAFSLLPLIAYTLLWAMIPKVQEDPKLMLAEV